MGEAKNRGCRDARILAAQAEQLREEPINVSCRTCKSVLNGFSLLSHTRAGAAWQKACDCGAITTAFVQPSEGTLARTFRQSLSLQNDILGVDRRTSVAFLQKSIDTVETGIVRLG